MLHALQPVTCKFEHAFPFGEEHDFDFRLCQAVLQDIFEFFDFRGRAVFAIENIIRVADHAHHGQLAHQLLLLLLRQRTPLGDVNQPRYLRFVVTIRLALLMAQRNKKVSVGAVREVPSRRPLSDGVAAMVGSGHAAVPGSGIPPAVLVHPIRKTRG